MATVSAPWVLEVRSDLGERQPRHMAARRLSWGDLPRPAVDWFDGRNERLRADFGSQVDGLSDAQLKEPPRSGSLFACEPGASGWPGPSFAG